MQQTRSSTGRGANVNKAAAGEEQNSEQPGGSNSGISEPSPAIAPGGPRSSAAATATPASSSSTNAKLRKPRHRQPSTNEPSASHPLSHSQDPPVKEKKRFRLFGSSSSSSRDQTSPTSTASRFFGGRSNSVRNNRPASFQGNTNNSRSPSVEHDSWLSPPSQTRPEPISEEDIVPTTNRSNPSFRHSIAILPPAAHDDKEAPQLDLPSPSSSLATPVSIFNPTTISVNTQSPDADDVGSKAWGERNRGPNPGPYGYPPHAYLSTDSRPSSRQSLEPSSPVQNLPYHPYPHPAVSATSVNKLDIKDISRDPSPLHTLPPHLQRATSNQGGATYLDPEPGKKPQSKQVRDMVAQDKNGDRGATPPPSKSKEDLASLDFSQLLSKHEELNDKYRKVKKYYFEKDAQVQQLQNTLAHQRLAQSRTSLDDNEYSNRFSRLDGAINNLAFNVRKDWKAVPPWLSPFVNSDATSKVTKEMTAVGRACISRWLVDEIFDRVFHPGLEPILSGNLKSIERNLRRFSPPVNTDEERDALLTKISNWRLATLDGLADLLGSPQATDYRNELTRSLVETLTSDLQMNLNHPPPAGLEAGVIGIIELAVGVAANLPLESRDVYVEYILPGIPFNDAYMKVEAQLPPLTNPGETYVTDQDQHLQQQRRGSADEPMGEDGQALGGQGNQVIGGFIGAGPKDKKGNGHAKKAEEEREKIEKVRFAAFMSVMVKGKSMLHKAPVFI